MKIKYKNYTMIPCTNAEERFDLFETVIATSKKDKSEYEREQDIAYGITVEGGISRIIACEMAKKDETVDLKRFLAEYLKQKQEILNILS